MVGNDRRRGKNLDGGAWKYLYYLDLYLVQSFIRTYRMQRDEENIEDNGENMEKLRSVSIRRANKHLKFRLSPTEGRNLNIQI